MKRICEIFKNNVIQLTFRLLPSEGAMPWAVSAPVSSKVSGDSHENPILQKYSASSKPWFDEQKKNEDALDAIASDFVVKEADEEDEQILQAASEDDTDEMEELLSDNDEADEDDPFDDAAFFDSDNFPGD